MASDFLLAEPDGKWHSLTCRDEKQNLEKLRCYSEKFNNLLITRVLSSAKKKKKKGSLHWLLTFLLLPALTEENPEKRSQPYKVLYAKTCLDTSIDLKKKAKSAAAAASGKGILGFPIPACLQLWNFSLVTNQTHDQKRSLAPGMDTHKRTSGLDS